MIFGTAAGVGLGVAGVTVYRRGRRPNGKHEPDRDQEEGDAASHGLRQDREEVDDASGWLGKIPRRTHEVVQTRPVRAALWGASAGLAVAGRNWRSPGYRLLGLRRVDARTGGAIGVRSALAGFLFDRARQATAGLLFRSQMRRGPDRMSELAPGLQAIERAHATDPQARQRAVSEFYRANAVRPTATCGWILAGPVVSQLVLALGIRDGRTVYDRVTGTIVVTDRQR